MAKQKWKGGTLLAPVPPALVTVSDGERDNVLTVAWTGILNSEPPTTYISVRPTRFSHDLIEKSGEFVIHLPTVALAKAVDRCGVFTGRKVDKFKEMALTKETANEVSAPLIAECPIALECRVRETIALGSHDMFVADILCVDVDERLIDDNGKLHIERADLLCFAHGAYFALGRRIGGFGFAVRKKKPASAANNNKKKGK